MLEIRDLSVTFASKGRAVPAVRGASLTIRPGETVALVGESGSGKSTLGQAIMGLQRFEGGASVAGEIRFVDKQDRALELTRLPERAFRRLRGNDIAMVFQEPLSSLNPLISIGDQIAESLREHRRIGGKAAMAEALSLLQQLGLPNPEKCLTSYPHQISGGMRQRVMIAIALACEPKLLIADEPTTALDVTIQAQIVDLLKRLQARTGLAILFITHDLGLVAEIADRALVMYAGQIVEAAGIADLFARPLMPYTQALFQAIPEVGCSLIPGYRLQPIAGNPPNPAQLPLGCAFQPRCPAARQDCSAKAPDLEAAGEGRQVRCRYWQEIASAEVSA